MAVPIINLLINVLTLYQWVVIAYIVLGWLFYFNIVNRHQPLVYKVNDVLMRLTEPILRRIRRFMPDLGGIDISPIILFLIVFFLKDVLYELRYSIQY